MHVEADRGIGVSAKTVGELRKVAAWPDNLVITTPQERYAGSVIRVSKTRRCDARHAKTLSLSSTRVYRQRASSI
jgi:hypothetical protein